MKKIDFICKMEKVKNGDLRMLRIKNLKSPLPKIKYIKSSIAFK